MNCRNLDERLYQLQRCGCRRCEQEYYRERGDYWRLRDCDYGNRQMVTYASSVPSIASILSYPPKPPETKMEEPKNIAIKLLVDKLKSEQGSLASNVSSLKTYEDSAKRYREAKGKNLKAIKELATALKKLGHKTND